DCHFLRNTTNTTPAANDNRPIAKILNTLLFVFGNVSSFTSSDFVVLFVTFTSGSSVVVVVLSASTLVLLSLLSSLSFDGVSSFGSSVSSCSGTSVSSINESL